MSSDANHRQSELLVQVRRALEQITSLQEQLRLIEKTLACDESGADDSAAPTPSLGNPSDTSPADLFSEPGVSLTRADLPESIDLEKWLLDRGVEIVQLPSNHTFDGPFDDLARYVGDHFDHLRPFYRALKQRASGNSYPKTLSFQEIPKDSVQNIIQFGQRLKKNGFLKEFRPLKNGRKRPQLVRFEPQDGGAANHFHNFINGGWLERYVSLKVSDHLYPNGAGERIHTLLNPEILLPGNQRFEFDVLLAHLATVLWFECKTGDYSGRLVDYGRIAREVLQLPPTQAALVVLEQLTSAEKANLTEMSGGITVINPEDLPAFLESLGTSTPAAATPDAPPRARLSNRYATALRKLKLRPLKSSHRLKILSDLRNLASAAKEPIPLRDLVNRLWEDYQGNAEGISKSMINNISTALRHAGLCRRGSHPGYETDVWFLDVDLSIEEMLDRCMQLYVWTALKQAGPTALDAAQVSELAHTLFPDQVETEEAVRTIYAAIDALVHTGRCDRQESYGQQVVHARGDVFDESLFVGAGGAGPEVAQSYSLEAAAQYRTWLHKRNLNPLEPAQRHQIIEALFAANQREQLQFTELQKEVKRRLEAVGDAISKGKIGHVATALRRAGLCERRADPALANGKLVLRRGVAPGAMFEMSAQLYLWTLLKNPEWETDDQLNRPAVASVIRGDLSSSADSTEYVEQLLEQLGRAGKCRKEQGRWFAVGERFAE